MLPARVKQGDIVFLCQLSYPSEYLFPGTFDYISHIFVGDNIVVWQYRTVAVKLSFQKAGMNLEGSLCEKTLGPVPWKGKNTSTKHSQGTNSESLPRMMVHYVLNHVRALCMGTTTDNEDQVCTQGKNSQIQVFTKQTRKHEYYQEDTER